MLLRRHNLNLLPVLRELLRTRSVSRTAEAVGLGQSSVSAALARLRIEFDDPLLVPDGRGLQLTEAARRLLDPVERACAEIEAVLHPAAFSPAEETRRFVVATADYVAYLLAPPLVRLLSREAPNASVHFVDIGAQVEERLVRGEIDVLAIPRSTAGPVPKRFGSISLFTDETVVIAAAENPRLGQGLDRAAFEACPQASFHLAGKSATSHEDSQLRRARISRRDRVLVEQFLTLPAIVEATDCIALVQQRLAIRFQRDHAIAIHDPPFETDPIDIVGLWSRSSERDPSHRWFRTLLTLAADTLRTRSTPS